jgi:hypothetical protein
VGDHLQALIGAIHPRGLLELLRYLIDEARGGRSELAGDRVAVDALRRPRKTRGGGGTALTVGVSGVA